MTALSGVVALLMASLQARPPDTILHNARIFTADPARPNAEAFAVRDGRIVTVGSSRDLLGTAGPDTRTIDLQGAFVAPGFGDSHLHFMSGSLTLNAITLDGLTSREQILAKIAAHAKANPSALWVTGRGWSYGAFPGGLPHRKWLDEAVPDREVAAAQHLASRPSPYQCGEAVLLREGRHHFAGAEGVLVHEHHDPPVERLRTKTLSRQTDRAILVEHEEANRHP